MKICQHQLGDLPCGFMVCSKHQLLACYLDLGLMHEISTVIW